MIISMIIGIGIAIGAIAAATSVGVAWVWVMGMIDDRRTRREGRGIAAEVPSDHARTLDRIDQLERELEIGKYSPAARELQLELDVENAMEQMRTVSGFGKITEHEWRLALKKANDRGMTPKVIVCGVGQERHSMAAGQLDILESKNPDVDPRFLAIGLMWRYRPGGEFDQHNGRSDRKVARRAPLRRIVRADGEVEEIRAFGG